MKLLISNIKNEKAILKNSEYENILSKSELERVRKFSSQKRKNEFILGRILLRAYLSKKLRKEEKDININVAKNGAILILETLNNKQLFASISHSNDYVVVAIDYFPLGIDIEFKKERKDFFKLSKVAFNDKNLIYKIKDEKDLEKIKDYFYNAWTKKEALYKLESTLKNYKNDFSSSYKIKFINKKLINDFSFTISKASPCMK
ncbi:MAG: hypothetical protein SPJ04_04280 [Bdellovibrionota bacterium]|nr:4'-phosphopantetheinyl transferase superfamily protein [Pseudomonadota bacterium]MDY6090454.1 hypothetical protein [Bdellovibrionota bacterium]